MEHADQPIHRDQPALCAACVATAHTLAAMGPPNDHVIKRCDCAGENSSVIAVAAKREGRIVHWHLEGPMTAAQADMAGASVLAQFTQAGAGKHVLRKQ